MVCLLTDQTSRQFLPRAEAHVLPEFTITVWSGEQLAEMAERMKQEGLA